MIRIKVLNSNIFDINFRRCFQQDVEGLDHRAMERRDFQKVNVKNGSSCDDISTQSLFIVRIVALEQS